MSDRSTYEADNFATEFGEMVASLHGFETCREPWRLYYDETENWRSISYKNGRVNDPRAFEKDFILGGILLTDEAAISDLKEGAQKLPSPNGEVKSKSVLGGSSDFWKVLRRQETTDYLDLIDREGASVHYHAQDNLYFSIVDIVDSLIAMPAHSACLMFNRELKDELYLCARQDPIAFLNGLAHFGYPNIEQNNLRDFCEFLLYVISFRQLTECPADEPEGFMLETLRQMVKAASKERILLLLEGNGEGALVEDFSGHYATTCAVLPNAKHFFDEESHISMALAAPIGNYEFIDSKSEPLIQLSDVWVGLLSRVFSFLDGWVRNPYMPEKRLLHSREMENLRTVKRLIDRANDLHRSLISNTNANSTILGRENALNIICNL